MISRKRHQSLPFGVSEHDLDRARFVVGLPTRGLFPGIRNESAYRGLNLDMYQNRSDPSVAFSRSARYSFRDGGNEFRSYASRNVLGETFGFDKPSYRSLGTSNYTGYDRNLLGGMSTSSLGFERRRSSQGLGLNSFRKSSEFSGYDDGVNEHMSISMLGLDRSRDYQQKSLKNGGSYPEFQRSSLYTDPIRSLSEHRTDLPLEISRKTRYPSGIGLTDYGSHVDLIRSLHLKSSVKDAKENESDLSFSIDRHSRLPSASGSTLLSRGDLDLGFDNQIISTRDSINVSLLLIHIY